MTDNLVKFPGKKGTEPPSPEEIKSKIAINKANSVDEITQILQGEIIDIFKEVGLDPDEDMELFNETCFLIEALRAFVAKKYGVEHAFHKFAANLFTIDKDGRVFFVSPDFKYIEELPVEKKEEDNPTS